MEPRPAATVVVARPARAGVEVLLLRRSAASRFAPGFVVFPGGLIEPGDRDLASRWWGDPSEEWRACALRELYEEAGLLLTAGGLTERAPERAIGEVPFEPPPTAAMREMARWLAPELLEVRFDARFYAAAAPAGLTLRADGVEIDRAWWGGAGEVLRASTRGEAALMWPTLVTLEALAGCRSVEEVLGLRVEQVEPGREDRAAPLRGAWTRPEGR